MKKPSKQAKKQNRGGKKAKKQYKVRNWREYNQASLVCGYTTLHTKSIRYPHCEVFAPYAIAQGYGDESSVFSPLLEIEFLQPYLHVTIVLQRFYGSCG